MTSSSTFNERSCYTTSISLKRNPDNMFAASNISSCKNIDKYAFLLKNEDLERIDEEEDEKGKSYTFIKLILWIVTPEISQQFLKPKRSKIYLIDKFKVSKLLRDTKCFRFARKKKGSLACFQEIDIVRIHLFTVLGRLREQYLFRP